MTSTIRPLSAAPSMLGGSIETPSRQCTHPPARSVSPWVGKPGTAGRVAVVGAGKMGLPLAAQFANHGWHVVAVDVQEAVVAAINEGRSHVAEEPGLAEAVREAHASGRLRATTDGGAAARESDVVVLIVPVMLDDEQQPDYRFMDSAVAAIAPGVHAGSTIIFETTLPVGDTRQRFTPRLEEASGLRADEDFFVAFSPERLFSGAVFRNLAAYPKLVGGIGPASTDRAVAFYASVLDADVVPLSSAEFGGILEARRHDLPRRQHRPGERVRAVCRPRRGRHPGSHLRGEQPALQPHPPAGPGGGRPLHPGLSAFPAQPGAGDGAGGAVAPHQRRPGGNRDPDHSEGAGRPRRRAGPRPRADVPGRRPRAGVLTGPAAHRTARRSTARSCRPGTRS